MPKQHKIDPTALHFPEQIQRKLDYIKQYPLTVLYAPAGFGKTTALTHYFRENVAETVPVLSQTFLSGRAKTGWQALCSLLERVDSACGTELRRIGVPNIDNLGTIADVLENLQCEQETYLVLDSFELCGIPEPERLLILLSGHGGEQLHVVVATRFLDEQQLQRGYHIYRLGAEDFVFDQEETCTYFKKIGLGVTETDIAKVHGMTGGWILALHMQAMAFWKSGKFPNAGTNGLIQQVLWERLSEREREFFLAVSIFPRFTLSQALELSELDGEEIDHLLTAQAAFVHEEEDENQSFYLHTVLVSFLNKKFELLPAARRQEIYLRGGDVARRSGDRVNALRFYYYSGHWERLFAQQMNSYDLADAVNEETRPMILDIVRNAPLELKAKYPAFLLPLAFTLFFLGENQLLAEMGDEIERLIEESDLETAHKNALLGEMELLLSFQKYNHIDAMSVHHRKALELLGGPASLIDLKSTWTFGAPSILYMYWSEQGGLERELADMDACMPIYYKLTRGHGSGAELVMRAEALFQRGRVEEAERLCHRALRTAQRAEQNSIYLCGLFLMAQIALFRGDTTALQSTRETLTQRAKLNEEDLCRYTHDLCHGWVSATGGDADGVPLWLQEGEVDDQRLVVMTQPFAYIIYCRCLLLRQEYSKLIGVCHLMLKVAGIFSYMLPQLYAQIYLAQAYHALGDYAQAHSELQTALRIGGADQVYMPFAENYGGLSPLLAEAATPENQEMLDGIAGLGEQMSTALRVFRSTASPLSPREREIYMLIKSGVTSHKDIAKTLHISVSTVKSLLARIFDKVGVSSKMQLMLKDL